MTNDRAGVGAVSLDRALIELQQERLTAPHSVTAYCATCTAPFEWGSAHECQLSRRARLDLERFRREMDKAAAEQYAREHFACPDCGEMTGPPPDVHACTGGTKARQTETQEMEAWAARLRAVGFKIEKEHQ